MTQQVIEFAGTVQCCLKNYCLDFQHRFEALHRYEQLMFEVSLANRQKHFRKKGYTLQTVGELHAALSDLRSQLLRVAAQGAKKCKAAQTVGEATEVYEESLQMQVDLLQANARVVEFADEVVFELRRMPAIDFRHPVVVMVGMPNVGKSSLVRALSTGKPEVQNYPFTTRTIIAGHITDEEAPGLEEQPFQILDTPGILERQSHNAMEQLTLASVGSLDSVVAYVLDMSGFSQPVDKQLRVRAAMKAAFQHERAGRGRADDRGSSSGTCSTSTSSTSTSSTSSDNNNNNNLWIDVVSKSDLLTPELVSQMEAELPGALVTSSNTSAGIPVLHAAMMRALRAAVANHQGRPRGGRRPPRKRF